MSDFLKKLSNDFIKRKPYEFNILKLYFEPKYEDIETSDNYQMRLERGNYNASSGYGYMCLKPESMYEINSNFYENKHDEKFEIKSYILIDEKLYEEIYENHWSELYKLFKISHNKEIERVIEEVTKFKI